MKAKKKRGRPTKGLSIRLTPEKHDALRKIAFERRVSIHSLFLEGVDFVVKTADVHELTLGTILKKFLQ